MTLRKSTKVWILLFGVGVALTAIQNSVKGELGCLGVLTAVVAFVAGMALLSTAIAAAFRAIIRRLALRLAF